MSQARGASRLGGGGPNTTFLEHEEKLKRYRAVFDSLDTDGSGTLSPDELEQAVLALGRDATHLEEALGAKDNVLLTFDDFVELMEATQEKFANELLSDEDDNSSADSDSTRNSTMLRLQTLDVDTAKLYRSLFNELDTTKADYLTADVLQAHMRNLSLRGVTISPEELNFYFALVEAADATPNKQLDVEGFALVAQDHEDFFDQYRMRLVGVPLLPSVFRNSRNLELGVSNYSRASSARPALTAEALAQIPDLDKYRQVFEVFDQDRKGRVTDVDVTSMMHKLGRVPTEQESAFLFELLQMVGDNGFEFEDFVALMQEDVDGLGKLGKSISIWQPRQATKQRVRSMKLSRANMSRMGLTRNIEHEGLKLQKQDSTGLERINNRISHQSPAVQNAPFQFARLPTSAMTFPSPVPGASRPTSVKISNTPTYQLPSGSRGAGVEASALLTPMEMLRYQTVFNALDRNLDGMVTVDEILQSAKSVTGRQPSQEEVREFVQRADLNGTGSITFEEFVVIMQRTKRLLGRNNMFASSDVEDAAQTRKREKYRVVFDTFDANKDGSITTQELRNQLIAMGKKIDENACRHMLNTFDSNKNGALEFDEFVQLMDNLVAKEFGL